MRAYATETGGSLLAFIQGENGLVLAALVAWAARHGPAGGVR